MKKIKLVYLLIAIAVIVLAAFIIFDWDCFIQGFKEGYKEGLSS